MKRRNFIKQSAFAGASLAALGGLSSCRLNELGVVKLTILHTNDVHSRIDPFPTTDSKYPGLGGPGGARCQWKLGYDYKDLTSPCFVVMRHSSSLEVSLLKTPFS